MIVDSFGLKKYSFTCVTPEVSDWISAMTSTWQDLQFTVAFSVRTLLSLLLLASFVANVRSQVYSCAEFLVDHASFRADHHAQARLLQYMNIVVVCIPHRPAGCMSSSLFVICSVDSSAMSVSPFVEFIIVSYFGYRVVVDIPADGIDENVMLNIIAAIFVVYSCAYICLP